MILYYFFTFLIAIICLSIFIFFLYNVLYCLIKLSSEFQQLLQKETAVHPVIVVNIPTATVVQIAPSEQHV